MERDDNQVPEKEAEQKYQFSPAGLSLKGDALRRRADESVVADIDLKDITEIRWQAGREFGCIFISLLLAGGAATLIYLRHSDTTLLITAIIMGVLGLLGMIGSVTTHKIKVFIRTAKQNFEFSCSGSIEDWKAFLYEIDKHARKKGFTILIISSQGSMGID